MDLLGHERTHRVSSSFFPASVISGSRNDEEDGEETDVRSRRANRGDRSSSSSNSQSVLIVMKFPLLTLH